MFVLPEKENERVVPGEVERLKHIREGCNVATRHSKNANGIFKSDTNVRFGATGSLRILELMWITRHRFRHGTGLRWR